MGHYSHMPHFNPHSQWMIPHLQSVSVGNVELCVLKHVLSASAVYDSLFVIDFIDGLALPLYCDCPGGLTG